jgi:pyruvate dehydrogenase phosphatase
VACTGDSRAIPGRKNGEGLWSTVPLSADQTGGNPDEAARIRDAHPGEETAVSGGRVLGGLELARAFGDGLYKWTREGSLYLRKIYLARKPSEHVLTSPYVTAELLITTTKILPEKGDFVVMASDALWEMLSNEEVIGLVGRWIENVLHQESFVGRAYYQRFGL